VNRVRHAKYFAMSGPGRNARGSDVSASAVISRRDRCGTLSRLPRYSSATLGLQGGFARARGAHIASTAARLGSPGRGSLRLLRCDSGERHDRLENRIVPGGLDVPFHVGSDCQYSPPHRRSARGRGQDLARRARVRCGHCQAKATTVFAGDRPRTFFASALASCFALHLLHVAMTESMPLTVDTGARRSQGSPVAITKPYTSPT